MKSKKGVILDTWMVWGVIIIIVFILVMLLFGRVRGGSLGLLDRISDMLGLFVPFTARRFDKKAAVGLVPKRILILVLLLIGAAIIVLFATGAFDKAVESVHNLFALAP